MLFCDVLFYPHHFENMFVSIAYTDADIDSTLQKAEDFINGMQKRFGK